MQIGVPKIYRESSNGDFFFFTTTSEFIGPFLKAKKEEKMFSKNPLSKFLLSRPCELYPKGKLRIPTSNHGFLASKYYQLSHFFFSCPLPFSVQCRTVHLPLGTALHYLQEQVDSLQTLVTSLTACYPDLPFPDFGQWEVRNYPFLREHLL